MQYPLVVSDMDGTLLRNDKSISERTQKSIQRFVAAGGHFTLATGRGVEASARYVTELGLTTPMVLLNGCLVYNPITGEDVLCRLLDRPVLDQVWPILISHDIDLVVHSSRRGCSIRMNDRIAQHLRHDGITIDVNPELNPATAGAAVKILTIGAEAELDTVEAALRQSDAAVKLVRSHPEYLEVLPAGGGKGSALKALAEHLGVPLAHTLAVGDYLNDVDLLSTAGLGVAMGNAHPQIKRLARRWTASNMEDGVACLLDAIVEGRPVGVAPTPDDEATA